jgi:hypothetical protein
VKNVRGAERADEFEQKNGVPAEEKGGHYCPFPRKQNVRQAEK